MSVNSLTGVAGQRCAFSQEMGRKQAFAFLFLLHRTYDYELCLWQISVVEPSLAIADKQKEPTLADSFCLAGVAGLEPTTPGFGDQCSTN